MSQWPFSDSLHSTYRILCYSVLEIALCDMGYKRQDLGKTDVNSFEIMNCSQTTVLDKIVMAL